MLRREPVGCLLVLTLTFVLSPLRLEIWNNTPSKSATVTSIDSGLVLTRRRKTNKRANKLDDCAIQKGQRTQGRFTSVENSHDNQDCVIKPFNVEYDREGETCKKFIESLMMSHGWYFCPSPSYILSAHK